MAIDTLKLKVGGAWKSPSNIKVKVGGAWKDEAETYVKVNGVWKLAHKSSVPYGIVYYKENASSTAVVRSVEIQNQEEFDSLARNVTSWSAKIGREEVTVTSNGSKNIIVGIDIGDQITSLSDHFLQNCTSLNMALTIPSNVTSIGNSFLSGCTLFNQTLIMPSSITSIGVRFLSGCTRFNQPLTLPGDLTSIGTYFMYNTDSMVQYVDVGSLDAAITTANIYSFSTTTSTAASYTTGVKIKGANRAAWLSKLWNRTSSPYRKLVDYGS